MDSSYQQQYSQKLKEQMYSLSSNSSTSNLSSIGSNPTILHPTNNGSMSKAMDEFPQGSDVAILDDAPPFAHGVRMTWHSATSDLDLDSPDQYEVLKDFRFKNNRALTLCLVLPICYFLSCGGPRGIEPAILSGGPMLGLLAIVLFPIFFSLPLAMVVAELCTAFPDDGGYVIWVKNAFGPFFGFQQGFWAWVSNNLATASCPILVLEGLKTAFGELGSPVVEYLLKVVIAVVLSLPTLFGVKLVSRTSCFLAVLVLVPTIVLTVKCFAKADHWDNLDDIKHANTTNSASSNSSAPIDVDWRQLLTTVFWKYDGIYFVSLFGGQIANPVYTYPRAIFINLGLMVISYIVPVLAMVVAANKEWETYTSGSMIDVAQSIGGDVMRGMQLVSVICSNAGLYLATTFATCYQVSGMAENELIPKVFSKEHYLFETPYYALLLNVVPVLFVMAFDLNILQQTANCFSAAVQIFIIVAALKLRLHHGDIYRPSKVPGGLVVVTLLMIIPFTVLGFVIFTAFTSAIPAIIAGALVVVGVLYALLFL